MLLTNQNNTEIVNQLNLMIMEKYIKKFIDIGIIDIAEVGGKNASLGEMYTKLISKGILVPKGFAVTAAAFRYFLSHNVLQDALNSILENLDTIHFSNLPLVGKNARDLILKGHMPKDLELAIVDFYDRVFETNDQSVAVRSSATAEDLPEASFAGQHESFLNVKGHQELLYAVKKCFASLYTDRAIKYREDLGFEHAKVFLSVGIQEMIRSDMGCSGIGFTLEPESGFKEVVHIAGVWGLGENIVQGTVNPDEFLVFKPTLKKGLKSIIQKKLGSKEKKMIYAPKEDAVNTTINEQTSDLLRQKFVLEDREIEQLAKWSLIIEQHYQKPMDFEWAKDGFNHQLYIIQARPETVHSQKDSLEFNSYQLIEKGLEITKGEAIGNKISSGRAKILTSIEDANQLQEGDVIVTDTISPDWDPILKNISGIVTNQGGRTSHAAIIARELGITAIVGAVNATEVIKDEQEITLSCAEGKIAYVYAGKLKWKQTLIDPANLHLPKLPKIQMIMADPDKAFQLSFYPNDGVGLVRLEFIISNTVQVHPMSLIHFDQVKGAEDRLKIEQLTASYPLKEDYFIDKLSQGIATIAAAFYPKEVIVRMSDFKSNEYAGLLGGHAFEPEEENPMIGFRGASRYDHDRYREGFRLECMAMKVVRDEMGFSNVKLMIPFCRTVQEGQKVIALMEKYGLKRGENGLEIFVMAEIPSNVLLAEEFAEVFDGFSIGSNDLTQLTLGVDRDSALLAGLFDEENEACTKMITKMIEKANKLHKKVGICGQGPSDDPHFIRTLIDAGIDSISFNPDALIEGIRRVNEINKMNELYMESLF